ncbi:MAG TPA: hypothetical protein VMT63_12670 [Bacteroidales bacterium]|nr:hypothetical protein [Bacteroidales bacterium]
MKKSGSFIVYGMLLISGILLLNFTSAQAQAPVKPVKEIVKPSALPQNAEGPIIVYPQEKIVLHNFPRVALFEWKMFQGAKGYEFELEINDGQWRMLKSEKLDKNSLKVELPGDNPYRFRVRADLGNGSFSKWSAREFSYNTSKTGNTGGQGHTGTASGEKNLGVPQILGPADGSSLSDFPRRTKLDWGVVEGATEYEVQVEAKEGNDWKVLKNVKEKGTSFTFDFPGKQAGRWRVCAIAGEKKGPFTKWTNFVYTK